MSWTQERTETARKLWIEGKSASEIAKAIGDVSRNAVIGRMHRIGAAGPEATVRRAALPPRTGGAGAGRKPYVPRPKREPKPRREVKKTAAVFNFGGLGTSHGQRKRPVAPPAPSADLAIAPRIWTSRVFGECAFPVDGDGADTRSCCNRTEETYCQAHREIMHGSMPKSWSEYDKERFARKVA